MKKDKLITDKNEATDAVMSFVKFRIAPTVGVISIVFVPVDSETGKELDEFQRAIIQESRAPPVGLDAGLKMQLGVPKGLPAEAVAFLLRLSLDHINGQLGRKATKDPAALDEVTPNGFDLSVEGGPEFKGISAVETIDAMLCCMGDAEMIDCVFHVKSGGAK
jgi:hypothetical protein